MTLSNRLKIPEEVVYRRVGEETILLNVEIGSFYGLDPVGSRVWELLAEEVSLRDVLQSMAKEYEAPQECLQLDIQRLVQELKTMGLVRVVG